LITLTRLLTLLQHAEGESKDFQPSTDEEKEAIASLSKTVRMFEAL